MLGDSVQAGVEGLQRLLQGLPVPGLRGLSAPRGGLPRRRRPGAGRVRAAATGKASMIPKCRGPIARCSSRPMKPAEQPAPLTAEEAQDSAAKSGGWNASRRKADRRANGAQDKLTSENTEPMAVIGDDGLDLCGAGVVLALAGDPPGGPGDRRPRPRLDLRDAGDRVDGRAAGGRTARGPGDGRPSACWR